ncbi:non-heme iron oxygenase ferredoxin subunit [Streptomyces sp. B1866]|uniref:non-heme iron oxygenase ferredoxin subunit n=1 Tax=Streptomyces sp. B1866 TaxID=3075431 RepID=UPI002891A387|nr:non-heme iron oxygenase ferredoxin subunit [Streptomyces sp. B1866]MDT3398207.1 non-heme iron oxygenase ferredoxin subunit [Streptomyces sp. B1866]
MGPATDAPGAQDPAAGPSADEPSPDEPPPGEPSPGGGRAASRRVRLLPADALAPGQMRRVETSGAGPLAVYNVGGAVYVTADTCPHARVPLTDGDLEGDVVVCPAHLASFCVRTGAALSAFPPTGPLPAYPAAVEDGHIVAELPGAPGHAPGHTAGRRRAS